MSTISPAATSSKSKFQNTTKRLLSELRDLSFSDTATSSHQQPISGFERIGPVNDEDLFTWEAVMTGNCEELRGTGYEHGRWLLHLTIPPTYPLAPPTITFSTPITHPNIHPTTGEICLDLLKTSWTPAYTIATTLESIRDLLSLSADPESPLNVDVGVLMRMGDGVAVEGLVRWGARRERWEGR